MALFFSRNVESRYSTKHGVQLQKTVNEISAFPPQNKPHTRHNHTHAEEATNSAATATNAAPSTTTTPTAGGGKCAKCCCYMCFSGCQSKPTSDCWRMLQDEAGRSLAPQGPGQARSVLADTHASGALAQRAVVGPSGHPRSSWHRLK